MLFYGIMASVGAISLTIPSKCCHIWGWLTLIVYTLFSLNYLPLLYLQPSPISVYSQWASSCYLVAVASMDSFTGKYFSLQLLLKNR